MACAGGYRSERKRAAHPVNAHRPGAANSVMPGSPRNRRVSTAADERPAAAGWPPAATAANLPAARFQWTLFWIGATAALRVEFDAAGADLNSRRDCSNCAWTRYAHPVHLQTNRPAAISGNGSVCHILRISVCIPCIGAPSIGSRIGVPRIAGLLIGAARISSGSCGAAPG